MLRKFLITIFLSALIITENSIIFASNSKNSQKKKIYSLPQTSLVIDVNNGKVLHGQNHKIKIHPASLTKWMTLYLTFEAVKARKITLDKKLYISQRAASMPPCKMGLPAGDFITVRQAINSLIVGSHNDIAVVLAENIAGSEDKFAKLMTRTARAIGMKDTQFKNASGLHHNEQLTTALDLVKLSLAMKRDNPEFYPLLAKTNFTFRGKTYNGHNYVMKTYKYAKASKTGFTNPSGYNLITHAAVRDKDIIAVVTGHKTAVARNNKMIVLLDQYLGVTSVKVKTKSLKNTNTKVIRTAVNTNTSKKRPNNKRTVNKI